MAKRADKKPPGAQQEVYVPPGPVGRDFITDFESRLIYLQGPVGSGKSGACCIAIYQRAMMQPRSPKDGVRRSRWLVVRNTFQQLRDTTAATWRDWFPPELFGEFKQTAPMRHFIRVPDEQRGDVEIDVLFLALDEAADEGKLRSFEATGIWFNEARYIPRDLIDAGLQRVGRYPSKRDGGCHWYGVICDSNPGPEDHWASVMSGQAPMPTGISDAERQKLTKPDGWSFYIQPPAMFPVRNDAGDIERYELNPRAENLVNLPETYYPDLTKGRSHDEIAVDVLNRPGTLRSGKPVWPEFREDRHIAREPLQVVSDAPVWMGVDFGLTPACVIGQRIRDRYTVVHEIVATERMGAKRFAEWVRKELVSLFGSKVRLDGYGDPAGDQRAQTDETTPFQIWRAAGVPLRPAPSQGIDVRLDAVREVLTNLRDGYPALLVSPSCVGLKAALAGGYHYRFVKAGASSRYNDQPEKNQHSHVADALQYGLLGQGEGRSMMVNPMRQASKVVQTAQPIGRLGSF